MTHLKVRVRCVHCHKLRTVRTVFYPEEVAEAGGVRKLRARFIAEDLTPYVCLATRCQKATRDA